MKNDDAREEDFSRKEVGLPRAEGSWQRAETFFW